MTQRIFSESISDPQEAPAHRLPDTARQILISVNPKAGRTSPMIRAEALKQALEREGFSVQLMTDLDEVSKLANRFHEAGKLRALVGVGGDGTAAELTNRTVPGTPITLLPAGTANLISKYLKLPKSPQKLAKIIAAGTTMTFDAGRANGRLFLVMVSVGIDADIVRRVHAQREENYRNKTKKGAHISYWSYIRPIFQSIRSYQYPLVTLRMPSSAPPGPGSVSANDGNQRQISGKWLFVFNLPQYGWGLPLVPKCLGTDRQLDYCVFQRGKLASALFEVAMAQCGSLHRFLPHTKLGTATQYTLTANQETPYQLDGDPGGVLPLELELVPRRFTIVAPEKRIRKLLKKQRKAEETFH